MAVAFVGGKTSGARGVAGWGIRFLRYDALSLLVTVSSAWPRAVADDQREVRAPNHRQECAGHLWVFQRLAAQEGSSVRRGYAENAERQPERLERAADDILTGADLHEVSQEFGHVDLETRALDAPRTAFGDSD